MMRRLVQFALLIAMTTPIAGCGSDEQRVVVQPQVVDRPVATSCVPKDTPAADAYPDTDAVLRAAPDAPERYLLLYAGHKLRQSRLDLLEKLLKGCQ